MSDPFAAVTPESGELERAIKVKIDAIFDAEIEGHRFIRQPVRNDDGLFTELVEQLHHLQSTLTIERHNLKGLMDALPYPGDLNQVNLEVTRRKMLEMVEHIRRVGRNVGPVLDRLLALSQELLKNRTPVNAMHRVESITMTHVKK